mmetsp:Transcript_28452/g.83686  ORF Transcript_28452/g.83686 Transcript_28452/m.83686 type:complete len:147 (-) Transcript_28452:127-567(-)
MHQLGENRSLKRSLSVLSYAQLCPCVCIGLIQRRVTQLVCCAPSSIHLIHPSFFDKSHWKGKTIVIPFPPQCFQILSQGEEVYSSPMFTTSAICSDEILSTLSIIPIASPQKIRRTGNGKPEEFVFSNQTKPVWFLSPGTYSTEIV